MTSEAILSAIDAEISRLQQVRMLLIGNDVPAVAKKGPGRPKKASVPMPTKTAKKRTMSAEGKARIAAAQKRRWAATKKASK